MMDQRSCKSRKRRICFAAKAALVLYGSFGALFPEEVAASVASDAQISTTEPCATFSCYHDSVCTEGAANFSAFVTNDGVVLEMHAVESIDDRHCECSSDSWTGLKCDVPVESCGTTTTDHRCFNGGSCITNLESHLGEDQQFCDCNSAMDEAGNHYVGKYCEHRALGFCDASRRDFCIFGNCNPNYPDDPNTLLPCNCLDGYTGEHCQYEDKAVPDCSLHCLNGGACKLGLTSEEGGIVSGLVVETSEAATTEPGHSNPSHPYQYCSCREGYEGPDCGVKAVPCGDNFCYNSGWCVEREFDGELFFHCDCRPSETTTKSFAGRFCQYEDTAVCTDSGDLNGHLFCVNDGKCGDDPAMGCACPEGFRGFSCEIPELSLQQEATGSGGITISVESAQMTCDLDCGAHGVCRNGAKDLNGLGEAAKAEHLGHAEDGNMQHCVCEKGFVGLHCDSEVSTCGEGHEHFCLHGSECVALSNGFTCNCDVATSKLGEAFAGDHCEHPSTSVCTIGEPNRGRPLSFCVNHGSCVKMVTSDEPHPGCTCPGEWTGPHCEKPNIGSETDHPFDVVDDLPSSAHSNEQKRLYTPAVAFFVVATFVICVSFTLFLTRLNRERKKKGRKFARRRSSQAILALDMMHTESNNPCPRLYFGPERDDDGHELHTVSIA